MVHGPRICWTGWLTEEFESDPGKTLINQVVMGNWFNWISNIRYLSLFFVVPTPFSFHIYEYPPRGKIDPIEPIEAAEVSKRYILLNPLCLCGRINSKNAFRRHVQHVPATPVQCLAHRVSLGF